MKFTAIKKIDSEAIEKIQKEIELNNLLINNLEKTNILFCTNWDIMNENFVEIMRLKEILTKNNANILKILNKYIKK